MAVARSIRSSSTAAKQLGRTQRLDQAAERRRQSGMSSRSRNAQRGIRDRCSRALTPPLLFSARCRPQKLFVRAGRPGREHHAHAHEEGPVGGCCVHARLPAGEFVSRHDALLECELLCGIEKGQVTGELIVG